MRPDFLTYTRQDPRWPISNLWLKLWSIAIDAFLFILDAFSYFFGNAPLLIIAIGLVFSFLVIIKTTKQKLYLIIFFAFFFILLMTFFMIIKQPQMVWPGIRRVYYALPLNLFILLFSAFVVSRLLYLWQKAKIPILLLLAGVFFFNIIALTTHYQKIKYSVESDQYKVYEYSPRLLQCLKDNQKSEAFFNLPAEIENVCKKLRN
ncbi:hypothetical protein HY612_01850 [Candidatus Roizmanbacteria bacterium]|nr:hypothetical protein [Candidatus Roizmanbacteria bacterium]